MEADNKALAISFTEKLIEAEALEMGLDQFFRDHTLYFYAPAKDQGVRDFAKRVTHDLPDYCSFDAFFSMYQDRFEAWYAAGKLDG